MFLNLKNTIFKYQKITFSKTQLFYILKPSATSEREEHTVKPRKIKYEIFNLLWTINE
jgi:hypothetical protein